MAEQLRKDYLDKYQGVQGEMHQVSQSDKSSAVGTTYLDKINMTREDAMKIQEQF